MINSLIEQLKKSALSGWQVRESRKVSYQSFLAREEREMSRTVETTRWLVSIYKKRESAQGPVLGMSNFTITPETINGFEKFLGEAMFAAELVSNQPFELPEKPSAYPDVELNDPSIGAGALPDLEQRLLSTVSKEKNTRLSAAEFFLSRVESRLANHKGLDAGQTETMAHTEIVLLSKDGGKENEYIDRYSRRYLRDFDVEGEIKQSAQAAREATKASLPKTGRFPVLLSEEPLDHLFNPILARASARLKYNRMLEINLGKSVVSGTVEGDKVTLWANNTLARAVGSYRFDSYGSPAQRVCLIKDNQLNQLLADQRYAQYLNSPVTGELGNLEIEPGSKTFAELSDAKNWGGTIYHLTAFSAFEPNAITGAFSAEIRAGFEISKTGVKPIKGGSVSGVLQKDLASCWMSGEREQRESVLVPKGVLFKQLTVTGA